MEIRINFVEFFETDIALSILSKLDDPADLIRAAAVSHSWRRFGELSQVKLTIFFYISIIN